MVFEVDAIQRDNAGLNRPGAVQFTERRYGGDLGMQRVGGVDFATRPTKDDRVDLQALWSTASALQRVRGVPDSGGAVQARWFHQGESVNVDASLRQLDRGFRADNGFIEEAGVRRGSLNLSRHWRPLGTFQEAGLYTDLQATDVPGQGRLRERSALGSYAWLPMLTQVWWTPVVDLRQRVDVATPEHRLAQWQLGISSLPTAWLTGVYFEYTGGQQLDVLRDRVGPGQELHAWAKLQPSSRLQVQLNVDRQSVRSGDGGPAWFSEVSRRWLVIYHVSTDQYLRLIDQLRRLRRDAPWAGQPGSEDERAVTLSWQWAFRPDQWLDAGWTRRHDLATNLPTTLAPDRQREVFVKWTAGWSR